MRFTTTIPANIVEVVAPSAMVVERRQGLTLLSVSERDAASVVSALGADTIHAGWPRGVISEPRGYASASAHVRR